jgi:peroxiredoxin
VAESLHEEFGGVQFIGVNLGVKEDIKKVIESRHISFPIVYDDDSKIAEAFGAEMQTNILIDKKGTIVYKERGFDEDIAKYLKKLSK